MAASLQQCVVHRSQRLAGLLAALAAALLAACAAPPPLAAAGMLHDEWFVAVPLDTGADDLFALNDAMRAYAARQWPTRARVRDPRRALVEALYRDGQLRLAYDGSRTRTAAQAFDARAGNCLSLVIMTAAFARHLDLQVSFQGVRVDATYSRQGGLYLSSGHVNLVLGPQMARGLLRQTEATSLVVDFLPPQDLAGQRVFPLAEATIVAMFMNNRAAEALAAGHLDEAYAWARRAVLGDPEFMAAANTLGVVYDRAGHADAAEQVLRQVLRRDPDNTNVLSNLVGLLRGGGRSGEAQALAERLAKLQPVPPFRDFDLGRQAMDAGDPRHALELFTSELRRQPDQDEVHFWAALAHWQLGEPEQAARHLQQAMANSLTQAGATRYSAKLDRLRAAARR